MCAPIVYCSSKYFQTCIILDDMSGSGATELIANTSLNNACQGVNALAYFFSTQ